MGKVLVVLLAVVVIAEIVAVVGLVAALFWLGTPATIGAAAAMLLVTLVAGVLALRAMQARH